ncbi:hypothetical protein ACEPAI_8243 [Sanghuangporus weigelae]
MPAQRNRRASTCKKDDNGPKDIQFCLEKGETYRPFTDPKRIAKNDAKRSSKHDARAHVNGVPDDYLGVLEVVGEVSTNLSDPRCATQPIAVMSATTLRASSEMPAPQQGSFRVEVSEEHGNVQVNDYTAPESVQIATEGSHVEHPHLRLRIPNPNDSRACSFAMQSPSSASPFPRSSCPAAPVVVPTDTYHHSPPSLALPNYLVNETDGGYETHSPHLLAFNNGQVVNSGLERHIFPFFDTREFDSGYGSPESISTFDSNESLASSCTPSSAISEIYGEHFYDPLDTRCVQCPSDASPTRSSPFELGEIFSPSNVITESISLASNDNAYSKIIAETQEITRGMHFDNQDLAYLDGDVKMHVFTGHGNPDVFLTTSGAMP